ncbi:MAG: hypothetical protein IT176_07460 [Acidobacteria bacterium]|nr:hypothetical protein [Acidobacteriota bacterium]
MLDQLTVLKRLAGRLEAAGIAHMVAGSIAASHYGRPRMTRDADLVVELQPEDAGRLEAILGGEFMRNPAGMREAIRCRGMFNVIHTQAMIKVDFVLLKSDAYRMAEVERRRRVRVDAIELWMLTPEDLVLSKLPWAKESRSEPQLNDVRSVLRIQHGAIDWPYLEGWAERLSVASLLQEVR